MLCERVLKEKTLKTYQTNIRDRVNDLQLRNLISDDKIAGIAQKAMFVRSYPHLYTSLMLSKNLQNLNDYYKAQKLSGGTELLKMFSCLKIKRAEEMASKILNFCVKIKLKKWRTTLGTI